MITTEFIQIFITGGTFDKEYNYVTGKLYFKDTHLREMLERGRCRLRYDMKTLMMIDSLDMTSADRDIIVHNCRQTEASRILITHGTDTMVETAEVVANVAELKNKTIVLTGALIPYAFGTSSDGFFNLGAALAYLQVLSPGVYIAMNGQYFHWDNVRKNKQTGNFEITNA
jgi:L-asparaginase